MASVVRTAGIPGLFVIYLVAHPPVLLAAEVIWKGAGVAWQAANVIMLLLAAATVQGAPRNGLMASMLALAAWAMFSALLRVGLFGGEMLPDLQVAIRILAAALVFYVSWGYASSTGRVSVLLTGAVFGQILALLSQAFGRVISLEIADRSYEMAITGVSTSVASFTGYLSSLFGILAFGRCSQSSQFWAKRRATLVFVLFLQVLVSLRRTAWLSMTFLYFYWWVLAKNKVRNLLGMLVLATTFIGVLLSNAQELVGALASRFLGSVASGYVSAAGREKFFAIAFDRIRNPEGPFEAILGIGSSGVKGLMAQQFGMEIGAHSVPLDIALNFGLGGLLLLIASSVLMLRAARHQSDSALRAMGTASVIVLFVFALSSGVMFEVAMFPAFVVVGFASARLLMLSRGNESDGASA